MLFAAVCCSVRSQHVTNDNVAYAPHTNDGFVTMKPKKIVIVRGDMTKQQSCTKNCLSTTFPKLSSDQNLPRIMVLCSPHPLLYRFFAEFDNILNSFAIWWPHKVHTELRKGRNAKTSHVVLQICL